MVKKDSPLPVNLGLPLLLFDSKTIRKLLARNVIFDTAAGKFTENDDTVVIPKDYEGKIRLSTLYPYFVTLDYALNNVVVVVATAAVALMFDDPLDTFIVISSTNRSHE